MHENINNLFNISYVEKLINSKISNIIYHKKNIWPGSYHLVIEYKIENKPSIFCSAHSSEPRENVYKALKFLWQENLINTDFAIPRPVLYSKEFNATFYEGIVGKNLFYFIKQKNNIKINNIVKLAGKLFAKLHSLEPKPEANFNVLNSRIKTVIPGFEALKEKIDNKLFQELYSYLIDQEEKYFNNSSSRLAIIHGDAHPENIIAINSKKIGLIDFTDICLADFARDLGSFTQQLDHMICFRQDGEKDIAENAKKIFLESYQENINIDFNQDILTRIENYYNWTALRSVAYYFTKEKSNLEKGNKLLMSTKLRMQNKIA